MQQENDKEMSFEFGRSRRYIFFVLFSSVLGFLTFIYLFLETYSSSSAFGDNGFPSYLLRFLFLLSSLTFIEDFFEYWQRLRFYNAKLREIQLTQSNLLTPENFKAEAISEIKWRDIKSLEIGHYNNGIRYFYLIKKQKKLLIKTDTKTYEIRKEDLTNKAEFKQLCLAIASRTNSEFEDKNGDLWI